MRRRVLVVDTSVFCCWLRIPGKDTAGPDDDRWDHSRINALLIEEQRQGSTLVLPIATVVETGNHIAQANSERFERARELAEHLSAAVDARSPWAAFTDQSVLWDNDNLRRLAAEWPPLAAGGLTIGDATIKAVAEYYARTGWDVRIITGDQGLKAYEPERVAPVPRRRR